MGMDWMDFKRVDGIEKRLAEVEAAIRALTDKLNEPQHEAAKAATTEPEGVYYFFRYRYDGGSMDLCVVPHGPFASDSVVISLESRQRIQEFRKSGNDPIDRYFRNASECREINEHMALNAIMCSAIGSMSKPDSQKCIDAYTAYCKSGENSTPKAYFKQASRTGVYALSQTAVWSVSDVSSRNRSRQPSRKFDLSNGRVNDIASVIPESSIEWHRQEVAKSKTQGPDANSFHTEITKAESLALISHGTPAEVAEKITLWFAWHMNPLGI